MGLWHVISSVRTWFCQCFSSFYYLINISKNKIKNGTGTQISSFLNHLKISILAELCYYFYWINLFLTGEIKKELKDDEKNEETSYALPLPKDNAELSTNIAAEKYFEPFELACKSKSAKIIVTSLDCIQVRQVKCVRFMALFHEQSSTTECYCQ